MNCSMRINVEIDSDLMDEALRVSGLRTKRQAIEEGLRLLIQAHQEGKTDHRRGKLNWDGSIDQMRRDH